MKLHYAATVLSVGFYLMTPPLIDLNTADPQAPLSHWTYLAVYNDAQACEQDRWDFAQREQQDFVAAMQDPNYKSGQFDAIFDQYRLARCVASDDPRLNGGN